MRPPPLTETQRARLARLEPPLRDASRRGDYAAAKGLAAEIQRVLRSTGHETRLQRAKNWLFQAAMESGELQTATSGFAGVRKKVRRSTRVYLEATALLAITYLRMRDVSAAEPFVREALELEGNIKSERKREQFRVRLVSRLEAEYLVALIADASLESLDAATVEHQAGRLLMSANEDEMLQYLGSALPAAQVQEARRLYAFSRSLLPPSSQNLLPSPEQKQRAEIVGGTLWEATKRVLWRALCDPENDIYRMWSGRLIEPATDYRIVAGAVAAALTGRNIGYFALASVATAFLIKTGVAVYCEVTKEDGLMIEPYE